MKRVAALSLLTAVLGLPPIRASAEEADRQEYRGLMLLAEIVASDQADNGKKAAKPAAEVRGKARAYRDSGSGSSSTIIVLPEEEEEGLLGPRRIPESSASQNINKARQYQQGQGSMSAPAPTFQDPANPPVTNAERAQDNRARARSYVSTSNTVVIERIGSDGIPIVACGKSVDNVAGRIGDDVQPGGIFFIMRDNKAFKVRCAE